MHSRSRRVSHTETVSSTETRISRVIETRQAQPTYIPSSEQHSTTIITDVTPQYDIKPIEARETHATTLKTDLKPQFQPVDLTISIPVPPKFVQALKNIETMEGTRVTFEGVVTGRWYFCCYTKYAQMVWFDMVLWCLIPLSTIFQLYRGCQGFGGGNRKTWRKPPTCRKSLTNFIT